MRDLFRNISIPGSPSTLVGFLEKDDVCICGREECSSRSADSDWPNPFLTKLSYRRDWLRPDIVAGLTTGAVIIPKAMAYAMMAGLPVQVGLYTALVPMVIYAVLGTSRVLSVSTTTTLAILTAAQLGQVVPNGNPAALLSASATLTLLVGAALLLACLLRLGFVANFISEPVLVGFRAGIGLVIVVDQIPKILGIHFTRGTFVQNVLSIGSQPSENVVSNAGRRAHDNRVSAGHGAFPAETASAVTGGSCCDRAARTS